MPNTDHPFVGLRTMNAGPGMHVLCPKKKEEACKKKKMVVLIDVQNGMCKWLA